MKFEKYKLSVYIVLIITGFVICLFFSIHSAIVLAIMSALILIYDILCKSERKNQTLKLSDEIDNILHGEEKFSLSEYEETEFSILTSEIHKMTIKLREQNSELESDKKFMKESLEDMSHQLRTPLTSVMLLIEMLREPELSRHSRMEYLNELSGLLSRMNMLIDTLLGISRIDAGAVSFKKEIISCRKLIDTAFDTVSVPMELKNITVIKEIEDESILMGDFQYFTEALLNILKNCMEHTSENGIIRIIASENPLFTEIMVADNGEGFNKEELPHIFERFYCSRKSNKSGYGIGLAFAKKIVVAQNGSLTAENSADGGAVFRLRVYKDKEAPQISDS